MRPARWGGRDGTGKSPSRRKRGGVERKSNLTLPSYVWVGGETAKWPNAAEGETVAAFLCLFEISDPPERKNYFLLRVCFLWEGEYTGREVWQKLHMGGASSRLGRMTPPHLCWMPLPNGFGSMHPRGEGRESRRSKGLRWWLFRRLPPPPPHRGKGPTPSPKPSPKPSKVAKVAAQPPH